MFAHRMSLLIPLLLLAAGALVVTACSGEPDLPDTNAASMLDYLDEVDYEESWSCGQVWVRSTRAASRTGCF